MISEKFRQCGETPRVVISLRINWIIEHRDLCVYGEEVQIYVVERKQRDIANENEHFE